MTAAIPWTRWFRAFHDAGFSILSITDHDMVAPNFCPLRDAATQGQIDFGAFATERTPYPDPRPPTFPAGHDVALERLRSTVPGRSRNAWDRGRRIDLHLSRQFVLQ